MGSPWNCVSAQGSRETRMMGFQTSKKFSDRFSRFHTIPECDSQPPSQTRCRSKYRDYAPITRSSADADKPARRVWRSIKVTKHSTIPYVRYRLLVFTLFDFKKCRDLKMGVKGHSRSLKVVPFDRLCMVSY